jgi:chromate reductase
LDSPGKMKSRKKILAICGSTRQQSANLNLIKAIVELFCNELDIKIYERLAEIPHFNPDLDTINPPGTVAEFRSELTEAEGILICTPEYAMGVPGTLKNAIDWSVSSGEFSHKPVALITASSRGESGHRHLLETLKVIECNIPIDSQLLISFVKTKVSSEGKITDSQTLEQVKKLMVSLDKSISQ